MTVLTKLGYVPLAECLPASNFSGSVFHDTGNRIQATLPITPTPIQQVLANPLYVLLENHSLACMVTGIES